MLKKWILLVAICFNLVSYAYTLNTQPKGDFTLKALSGAELKDALAKASKLKKGDEGKKPRAIKPIEQFTFNEATDILLEVTDANGALMYYLAAPKNKTKFCRPTTSTNSWVNFQNSGEAEGAFGDTWGKYFPPNGGGDPRVATNSVGMWIYATSYAEFANQVIFSRNYSGKGPTRTDYFHTVINADGTLQITSTITDYSVDRVYTTQPYPLNEWVYIQAFQQGNSYTIGWKSASGKEHIAGPKVFARQNEIYAENFETFMYNPTNSCMAVKEFFWQPGVNMFELMNNYNAYNKAIFQTTTPLIFGLDTELVNAINNAIMGQESPLSLNDFDVYVDTNGVVYVVDMRNTTLQ